jgi:hypothetical protein
MERGSHDVVAKDGAPVLEAFVGGQHSGGVFVTGVDQLEENSTAPSWLTGR